MSMRNWIAGRAGRFGHATMTLGGDRSGVTLLEYSLIGALIAAVCVSAVTTMGADLSNLFGSVTSRIESHS